MSGRSPLAAPPHVLREYAVLADGERGALIGPRGDISWLCLPQWHDDPVFSDLLGGRGTYAVTPSGRFVWGGFYEPSSLIWRSRWIVDDGAVIECREALTRPSNPRNAVLLRQVRAVSGTAPVQVALDLRAGAGAHRTSRLHQEGDTWTGRSGPLHVRWTGAIGARPGPDGELRTELSVAEGDAADLVLEVGLDEPGAPLNPDRLWSATTASWAEGVPDLECAAALA